MRQLAAILFADMTGYTALMQENEQLARQKRKKLKAVLEEAVGEYHGRILQHYGDGSLSMFNSAIDSVRSAINIQQKLREEPVVDLRIGIHTGDVIIEEEAIYGDGVNLASRIESLAVPGGIFISEKVYDEIRNQDGISARELGFFELKNVRQPVRVFAIANEGVIVPPRDAVKGKTAVGSNRLAVLPFVNMSADPENEYFSDGITEELLNALTKVDGLKVTSRTSAFAFKGKNHDIRDIGIQLNVDKILEGSVRKANNRVRITAQLINATDGYHIWSETYDRDLTDIFAVQDEISGIIATRMRDNMVHPPKEEHLVKPPTQNVKAYTWYLKGLHSWNKLTPGDTRKAVEYFKEAIELEPRYAQAHAMVAACYSYLGSSGQLLPDKAFEIVRDYANRAMELDSTVAESHIAMAAVYLFYDWNWQAAYDALQRAISLNPNAMDAYELLAFYYVIVGAKNKGLDILKEAEKLDPLSPVLIQSLGNLYSMNGLFDDAIRQAGKMLAVNPQMRASLELKGWAIGLKVDWNGALAIFEEVHRLTNHPLKGLMGLAYTYGKLGQREKALECIRKMELRQQQEPDAVIDMDLAAAWWGLNDVEKTLYYVNRSIDKRIGPIHFYLEHPGFERVKEDPRFEVVRRRLQN